MFGSSFYDAQSQTAAMLQALKDSQEEFLERAYLERVNPTPKWYSLQDPKIHQAWQAALENAKAPEDSSFQDTLQEWDQWLEEQHSHGVIFSRGDHVHYNAPRTHEDAPGSTISPEPIPGYHQKEIVA